MTDFTDEQAEAFAGLERAINRLDTALDRESGDLLADWVLVCGWHVADVTDGSAVTAYTRPGTPAYRVLGLLRSHIARHEGALAGDGGDIDDD